MNIQQEFLLDCLRFYTKDVVDAQVAAKAEKWLLESVDNFDVRKLSEIKLTRADLSSISEAIGKLQAHTDPLTETLRRDVLKVINEVTIPKWLKDPEVRGIELAYLDLDKFGQINKLYGQVAGDEVLKGFAEIMDRETRDSGILVRMGGDEFIFIRTVLKEDDFLDNLRGYLKGREVKLDNSDKKLLVSGSIGSVRKDKEQLAEMEMERIFDILAIEAGEDLLKHKEANKKKLRIRIRR